MRRALVLSAAIVVAFYVAVGHGEHLRPGAGMPPVVSGACLVLVGLAAVFLTPRPWKASPRLARQTGSTVAVARPATIAVRSPTSAAWLQRFLR